ncbi:P-loop containing nucleoside triphosphate hydrolase protein [Gorgonomyces haynaldii]|nr:P-loop containing nucleoside triphosphate hydrolase protein [Gorgonomyces haynaldii]
MKADFEVRPFYIHGDGTVIVEMFSPVAQEAEDLMVTIAEPVSRPKHIHEYRITPYSLYAAISVGLTQEDILSALDKLSKTQLPNEIIKFIKQHTQSYGKAKLVLKNNKFHVETNQKQMAQLMEHKDIQDALLSEPVVQLVLEPVQVERQQVSLDLFDLFEDTDFPELDQEQLQEITRLEQEALSQKHTDVHVSPDQTREQTVEEDEQREEEQLALRLDEEEDDLLSVEINPDLVQQVKKKCADLGLPLMEEYDFHTNDLPKLDMQLKPRTRLRPYQEQSLGKMFNASRARSGIIVLPCGAGKTLVGIAAASTIKKSCIVLCTSTVSVSQWAREFRRWTDIHQDDIATFSSESKQSFSRDSGVLITTYSMVTYSGKRAHDAQKMMEFLQSREWGFLLLDEVHVVPADMFQKVLTQIKAHCKLGLTATLVREDQKIEDLNYLVGPKLFEANWSELANKGFIAQVQCAEIRCPMVRSFFREYLREKSRKRQLIYTMNPYKIQVCQYLVNHHESLGHKILIYSDNVFALKHYAQTLNRPYIYGGTSQGERMRVLQQFRFNPALNTLFISKVGDTSIDLPEANCLIQISSQYGSRRQEAQRLGRILRQKQGTSAFFYTLVSADTEEMFYASKRQQFLVDQGYEFKIITEIDMSSIDLVYSTNQRQLELLNTVLIASQTELFEEEGDEEIETYSRQKGSLSSLSGGASMAYLEYNRGTTSGLKRQRHQ